MPEFRPGPEIEVQDHGDGWSVSLLADARHVPGMPMVARRWLVEPGGSSPLQQDGHRDERFLYVISGTGKVRVGNDVFTVDREDMVWLEPGDSYELEAADAPLEVLEAVSVPAVTER